MSLIAAIRPDDWNYVLLLHIGGAMILVGGMLTAASALALARGNVAVLRVGYWSLLIACLPAYVLMRIGAEWLYTEGGVERPSRGRESPALDQHRLHRRRRWPARARHSTRPRGHRRPPSAFRQGHRAPQHDDGHRSSYWRPSSLQSGRWPESPTDPLSLPGARLRPRSRRNF